jgi:protein required for attachment to host cells
MKRKWIVVANRIEARVFKAKPFSIVEKLTNPLGREKNKALTNDRPGWSRSAFAGSRNIHAMDGEKNPHEEAAIAFARQVAKYLEAKEQQHVFEEVVIAAEPKMLGRIRKAMPTYLSNFVTWIGKDYGHLSDSEIGKLLAETR